MNRTWGTKSPHQRRRVVLRTKVRWEMLGLTNPIHASTAPSIEDIRRQVSLAASQGLRSDTVSRSQQYDQKGKPGSKASRATPKRKANSKQT